MTDIIDQPKLIKTSRLTISSVDNQSAGFFSPGQPFRPMGPPDEAGRKLDYPIGYNLWLQPKEHDFGGISFFELRALSDAHDITRLLIETRKDQIEALKWNIAPITEDEDEDPSKEQTARAKDVTNFLKRPDGVTPFGTWLRQLVEDLLVLDAPCCYINRSNPDTRFEIISGDLIKLLVDEQGRRPAYPSPAYSQVIKGMPAWLYDTREMLYAMRNPRSHRIYGFSPVQQIVLTVNTALRKQVAALQYYSEGNIPDALIQVPKEWSANEILNYETAWNAVHSGNTAERRRAKFVPGEAKIIQTKEIVLKNDFDEWLARVACFAFSIPPTAFIKQMNRATSDTAKVAAAEEGLAPLMMWVVFFVNSLIQDYLGQDDMEFAWTEQEEVDPSAQAKVWDMKLRNGSMTINEVRDDMGLDSTEGGDENLIYLGNQPIVVSKVSENAEMQQQGVQQQQDQSDEKHQRFMDTPQQPPGAPVGGGQAPPASGAKAKPNAASSPAKTPPKAKPSGGSQKASRPFVGPITKSVGAEDLDHAAARADRNATHGQHHAGNYKKGHITIQGLPITIENMRGSIRRGKDKNCQEWESVLPAHYGYIKRTKGNDEDQVDVFIGQHPDSSIAFIVDQVKIENQKFDEHKVLIGFPDAKSAIDAYLSAFSDGKGPQRIGHITQVTIPELKAWLKQGDLRKPHSDLVKGHAKGKWHRLKPVDCSSSRFDKYRTRLKAQAQHVLKGLRSEVLKELRPVLGKLVKAEGDDAITQLDLSALLLFESEDPLTLSDIAADAAKEAIASFGVPVRGDLVNQANKSAADWARAHAADLVSNLSQATRNNLRATIAKGIEDGLTVEGISTAISDGYAFSDERAALIAETEVAFAVSHGALEVYKTFESQGTAVQKEWLAEADACIICSDNEDEGVIALSDDFSSGDDAPPAHPNCRCAVAPVVDSGSLAGLEEE